MNKQKQAQKVRKQLVLLKTYYFGSKQVNIHFIGLCNTKVSLISLMLNLVVSYQ